MLIWTAARERADIQDKYWFSLRKTPKALANSSPRLELRDYLGTRKNS